MFRIINATLAALCFLSALSTLPHVKASDALNIYGAPLKSCSQSGMALTGYTRNGSCTDIDDDAGSHHICIDLSSTTGGNFCSVTGQPDWCSSTMQCHSGSGLCPVENWCVCQWAFASYVENAGGCDEIQNIICDAINMQAPQAYMSYAGTKKYDDALACIETRCGVYFSEDES
mmetsp:Transcript_16930/g.23218  ORF Transcript_16930/g.23218 Transcript_16930/m.23218 type:complete len:174 (-) Transcript_16930:159-680(-)|eukprot:CAMPEP_0185731378 /NCGR_PEP_ID=MMETSP1171-20130828/12759_1 /TAXON_ID=374046 /ORGANISM="Helicotheca tamensis, Strain CCMP826" /LENGTH=173 /DNA_ID=CAMNT_0028400637 /DNA_START=44 /DNA_END=565 /DNA_ORIENTATION=+